MELYDDLRQLIEACSLSPVTRLLFDRALVALAHALATWRQGHHPVAGQFQLPTDDTAAREADPELVPVLHAWPGGEAPDRARGASPAVPVRSAAPALVIDGVRHQICDGEVAVDLLSRQVLRRLLYAFAAAGDRYLDRDAITRVLWRCDYDPLRHASSVNSNIRRLRGLLARTRLAIQTEHDGYRLSLPPGATFIAPHEAR
jgi:hypothetical protein